MMTAMTPAVMTKLVKALLRVALTGDVGAIKLALAYSVGEPQAADVLLEIEGMKEKLETFEYGTANGQRAV
jgi:hypothetical protein